MLAGPALRVLAASWRIRTIDEERWRPLYDARRPHVFLLWHEALLPLLWHHRRQSIAIVVSEARDGQYLADFAASLGYRAVRGSSTRGGARALLGAVRELRGRLRGGLHARRPARAAAGAQAGRGRGGAARRRSSSSRCMPRRDRAWRLDSWDRFMIPKPGARVRIRYGRPFEVAPGDDGLGGGTARGGGATAARSRRTSA